MSTQPQNNIQIDPQTITKIATHSGLSEEFIRRWTAALLAGVDADETQFIRIMFARLGEDLEANPIKAGAR